MWRGGEGKEEYVGKRVMRMDVEGRRRKGRICGEKSDEDGCGGNVYPSHPSPRHRDGYT